MKTPTLGVAALGAMLCVSLSAQTKFASPHEKKLGQPAPPTNAARLMENLDRGVVAVSRGAGKVRESDAEHLSDVRPHRACGRSSGRSSPRGERA